MTAILLCFFLVLLQKQTFLHQSTHYRQNSAIVTFVNGASNFVYDAFVFINGASVFANGAFNFVYGAFVFTYVASKPVNGASNFVKLVPLSLYMVPLCLKKCCRFFRKWCFEYSAVWERLSGDLTEENWGSVSKWRTPYPVFAILLQEKLQTFATVYRTIEYQSI